MTTCREVEPLHAARRPGDPALLQRPPEPGVHEPLLVFLRHFGCMFCREMVRDLRRISEAMPGFPPVLFFFQGTVEEGQSFFAQHWPQARAPISLPSKTRGYPSIVI